MLSFDDTTAFDLPHFTNRGYKGLPAARVAYVPWLCWDHSSGKKWYIYHAKNLYKKGGNRLMTSLHAVIHSVLNDANHPSMQARKLVLVADNCAENKNNTIFAGLQHMVLLNWFDEVELLFGPVGHTHNGVDQVHGIHNNGLGQHTIADFGHLVSKYEVVWPDQSKRPEPVLLEAQYNWDAYYKPHLRKLAGFNGCREGDDMSVHGFQFTRGRNSVVETYWKSSAGLDKAWRGMDGHEDSPAFKLLRSIPQGTPEVVAPANTITTQEYFRQFIGDKMASAMQFTPMLLGISDEHSHGAERQ